MKEVGPLTGCFFDPGLQALSHFPVLRENEHLATGFPTVPENVKEGGSLAGVRRCRFRLEVLRGRIADLLHARDELEHFTAADGADVGALRIFDRFLLELFELFHVRFEHLAVKRGLFRREVRELIHRVAFGQIGDDGLVAFQTTQHEGGRQAAERFGGRFAVIGLDRSGESLREILERSQKARLDGFQNRPVFAQSIFNGCTCHGDRLRGVEGFGRHGLA